MLRSIGRLRMLIRPVTRPAGKWAGQRWRKWSFLVTATLVLLSPASDLSASGGLCVGKQATLRCLKDNFDALYMADYSRFFGILRTAQTDATKCDSTARTVDFLEVAPFIKGNAEAGQYFAGVIERLCTTKPKCFLDALSRADDESRMDIIRELHTPTFLEESAIREVFLRHKGDPRYKAIMDLYFKP